MCLFVVLRRCGFFSYCCILQSQSASKYKTLATHIARFAVGGQFDSNLYKSTFRENPFTVTGKLQLIPTFIIITIHCLSYASYRARLLPSRGMACFSEMVQQKPKIFSIVCRSCFWESAIV